MTFREREIVRVATNASQDFPLLPTSDVDPTPLLAEEDDDNLTPAQRLAAAALVAGATFSAAARAAEVDRRTLYTWRQEPAFARAVDQTSREALSAVVVRVRNLMLRSTRVLGAAIDAERNDSAFQAFRVLNSAKFWAVAASDPDQASQSH